MTKRLAQAFTMVELAVVLVIMGIIGTVFFNFIYDFIDLERNEQAERMAETAGAQLAGYVLGEDGRLPEPDYSGADPAVVDSYLPASLGSFNDPWGHEFRYWCALDGSDEPIDITDETSTDLTIRIHNDPSTLGDEPPAPAALYKEISDVAYVVLSDGPNQQADVRITDGSIYVNLLRDGTPLAAGQQDSFDDIVAYKTLGEMKALYSSAGVDDDPYDPPEGYKLNLDFSADSYDSADLKNGATVTSIADAQGGTIDVLDVSDGAYLDLSERSSGYTFPEYTILGWFKTDSTTQDSDFDVITSRQDSSQSQPWNYRNWWVVLWADDYLTQGRGKQRGELSMKARTENEDDFNIDTDCDDRDCIGNNIDHHDGLWHYFAVRVRKDSDTEYRADAFVSEGAAGGRSLVNSSSTTTSADASAVPAGSELNHFEHDAAPKTEAGYTLYVGKGTASGRYFEGQIAHLVFYDEPLEDDVIIDYFDQVEGLYP